MWSLVRRLALDYIDRLADDALEYLERTIAEMQEQDLTRH